jgi:hypothetical protein
VTFNPATNTISGTPTVAGLFSPHINLVDSDGDVALASYSVTINAGLTITGPATLPSADVGRDYPPPSKTAVMTEAGGTAPFMWSDGGTLPPGLNIDPASGAISGNPTTLGTFSPTITLKDATNATTTRTYTNGITINPTPAITAPSGPSLPSWTTGQPGYSQQITVTGGTAPYTWQLSGGPAGLTINSSGLITGTPTGPQTYSMVVTATDADGVAAPQPYSLTINPALSISGTVPNGEVNIAYNATLTANSGTPPYTWTSSGSLPPGLTLTSGPTTATISGTPTVANSYSVSVTLHDSVGATATQNYSIVINPPPSIGTSALPSWTINQDYGSSNTTMSGSGGLTPYNWSDGGTLPPGLTVNPNTGSITGTPNTVGNYTVIMTLTDAVGVQATKSFTVAINPSPSITTTSLPDGEVNASYSASTAATSGTTPYKWTISSGLPPGLGINLNKGVISGSPTLSGSFPMKIVVTDAAGATNSVTISININPPATNGLSLSNQSGGGSLLVGTTLYYRGSTAGSFTITDNVATAGTALSANFATLAGTSTGFSHVASVVSTPPGGPFVSTTFSWTAGTSSAPTETITGTDSFNGTATTTLTFVNDSAAPAGGALTVNGTAANAAGTSSTATTTGFTIGTRTNYTETQSATQSGLASSTLTVQSETLTGGNTCGAPGSGGPFTSPTTITGTTQPGGIVTDFCYLYTLTGTDQVGNATSVNTTVTVAVPPTATSVVLANHTGGTVGLAEQNDTITVVFSRTMSVASFCNAWSGNATNQSLSGVTFTLSQSGSADAMLTTGTNANLCGAGQTFNFGSIDMGDPGYETKNKTTTFSNSTVAYTAASNTLVITLGIAAGGPPLTFTTATNPATYTPSTLITSPAGVAIAGTVSTPGHVQF